MQKKKEIKRYIPDLKKKKKMKEKWKKKISQRWGACVCVEQLIMLKRNFREWE